MNYETIMIINSQLKDEEIKNLIGKVENTIKKNGNIESIEEWGRRKLAYPIKKNNEGYYVLINFSSSPEFIDELNRIYNITDEILKHIIVNKD